MKGKTQKMESKQVEYIKNREQKNHRSRTQDIKGQDKAYIQKGAKERLRVAKLQCGVWGGMTNGILQ